jgi:2-dehydropantoate 2-reductase
MRFAILGSGAVGGYYGAKLARAGHDVTFIARGAHLQAIRERGLHVKSPMLGSFAVRAPAEDDTTRVGTVDVVIVAVSEEVRRLLPRRADGNANGEPVVWARGALNQRQPLPRSIRRRGDGDSIAAV